MRECRRVRYAEFWKCISTLSKTTNCCSNYNIVWFQGLYVLYIWTHTLAVSVLCSLMFTILRVTLSVHLRENQRFIAETKLWSKISTILKYLVL